MEMFVNRGDELFQFDFASLLGGGSGGAGGIGNILGTPSSLQCEKGPFNCGWSRWADGRQRRRGAGWPGYLSSSSPYLLGAKSFHFGMLEAG